MTLPIDLTKVPDAYMAVEVAAELTVAYKAALATLLNSLYQGTAVFDAAVTAFSVNMKARSRGVQRIS
jgi:hypothetical protein